MSLHACTRHHTSCQNRSTPNSKNTFVNPATEFQKGDKYKLKKVSVQLIGFRLPVTIPESSIKDSDDQSLKKIQVLSD